MSDAFDGHLSDSQEPEDLRELERRLDVDAALWSAGLPAAERAIERARRTPYTQTRSAADTERAVYLPVSSPRVERHALSMRGTDSMPMQRVRAFGAVATAVVVVALLAVLFMSFGGGKHHTTGLVGCGGSSCATGTPDSATPTAAVSPYSRYVTNIVLANGVDSNGQPIGPTDSFLVNQQVFVVMRVDNPPPGQHTVAVRWFLGDSALQLPGGEKTSNTVNGSENVWFALNYTSPGKGTVRILWDPPAGDEGTNL
ncbi:MAG TPA: hypothetical protein VF120_13495, partial [Ktedonobacterales bacterium]